MDSILNSIKKLLGVSQDYDVFDQDIIMHINSAFMILQQLGAGPKTPFMITDAEDKWTDFLGTGKGLELIKSYIYMRVRLMFDPPTTSFALDAINKQIQEFEWRINIQVDAYVPFVAPDQTLWWNVSGTGDFPPMAKEGDLGIDFVTGIVYRYEDE